MDLVFQDFLSIPVFPAEKQKKTANFKQNDTIIQ